MKPAAVLEPIRALVTSVGDPAHRLQAICALLQSQVPHYNWVGIYYAEPESRTLVLGPFVGAPTEHVRIPYGRGICGQAAERLRTLVVQDVTAEDNYLACSLAVQSEMVIPLFYNDRFVGELDIDSHTPAAFSAADRQFLEQVATLIAPLVATQSNF